MAFEKTHIPIPRLGSTVPADIRRAFEAFKEALSSIDANVSAVGASVPAIGSVGNTTKITEVITPTAPTGLTANGGFATILIAWDSAPYIGHSYTKIYRSQTNDIATAVYIGSSQSTMYSDIPPNNSLSQTYYYWIKFVSISNTEGPFNDSVGIAGSTADDPTYILENLVSDKWELLTAYSVDQVVTPITPDGRAMKCIVGGTTGATEPTWPTVVGNTVIDGGVTWELVTTTLTLESIFQTAFVDGAWVAAIKEAFIQNLTANNFVGLKITADEVVSNISITSPTIYGAKLMIGGNEIINPTTGVAYTQVNGTPTSLSDVNGTEGDKLTGIADGADVTGDNTSAAVEGQEIYRAYGTGYDYTSHTGRTALVSGALYNEAGTEISGFTKSQRSYIVHVYDRATKTWESHTIYDVYGDSANALAMANALNALTESKIVVITGQHAPAENRLTNGLPDAIYRCGGSKTVFENEDWTGSFPCYFLAGIPNQGAGSGMEIFAPATAAFIDVTFVIKNGNLITSTQTVEVTPGADKTVDVVGGIASTSFPAAVQNTNTTKADVGLPNVTDGATVGATWGTDITGQPSDTVLLNENTTPADIGYTGDLDADKTATAISATTEVTTGGLKMTDASSGDYVQMTPGELEFYQDSILYKAVRKVEYGVVDTNSSVIFSPAFKEIPTVFVSPHQIPTYDASYSNSDLSINCYASGVDVNGFDAHADLLVDGLGSILYSYAHTLSLGQELTRTCVNTNVTRIGITHHDGAGYAYYYDGGNFVFACDLPAKYFSGTTTTYFDLPSAGKWNIKIADDGSGSSTLVTNSVREYLGDDTVALSGSLNYIAVGL